jgi:hypothetical protein
MRFILVFQMLLCGESYGNVALIGVQTSILNTTAKLFLEHPHFIFSAFITQNEKSPGPYTKNKCISFLLMCFYCSVASTY